MERRGPRRLRVAFPDPGEQGVPEMPAASQHGQAGGFGDGNQVFILVEQRERTGSVRFPPRPPAIGEPLTRRKRCIERGRLVIQPYVAAQDPLPPGFLGGMRVAPEVELKNGFPFGFALNSVVIGPAAIH